MSDIGIGISIGKDVDTDSGVFSGTDIIGTDIIGTDIIGTDKGKVSSEGKVSTMSASKIDKMSSSIRSDTVSATADVKFCLNKILPI